MSRKTKQEEASRGLGRLVTAADASRLAGVHRGIGQLNTQNGIIVPTQPVGADGGWNRYGIIEIVELAVAKTLAEAGVRLGGRRGPIRIQLDDLQEWITQNRYNAEEVRSDG
ncbi:MAG: hypothetical protein KAV87_41280 [Desulfobacteraceae bacterium]|nr:hypothetical protein [Desulfobacteraceae bacterium]